MKAISWDAFRGNSFNAVILFANSLKCDTSLNLIRESALEDSTIILSLFWLKFTADCFR